MPIIFFYATLGSYVAFLAEVMQFPWRVIFGGFSVEDEQKPKLVSTYPQIPFWKKNTRLEGIALNGKCFWNMSQWYSKPCCRHEDQLLLQFGMRYFTLLVIVTSSFFSQNTKLNFDYLWCFDIFHYPIIFIHKSVCTDIR